MAKSDWIKEKDYKNRDLYKRLVECGHLQDNISVCYLPSEDYLWIFDFMSETRSFGFEVKSFEEADKLYNQLNNGDN